ncbi:MAG: ATP-binding cassette domain-containing protein [Paludibacteraceae bacterium]|nr:ATP-binding cassette domain-containing protein [Paludibacteraceae bacterium]
MFLYINNITKSFGTKTALKNVSFEIEKGSIVGLLGPNGAGKTTLIRSITGITQPDNGSILLNGNTIDDQERRKIGYLPEERGLYPEMKVGEQLLYLAQLKGMSKSEAKKECDFWLEKLQLTDRKSSRTNELSKGMQQKIQFISAVIHKPQFLILDEPFSGFDPINAETIKNEVLRLKGMGTTILLSTHDMGSVEELCDKVVLIHQAQIILDGPIDKIKEQYRNGSFIVRTTKTKEDKIQSPNFRIQSSTMKEDTIEWLIEKTNKEMDNNGFITELMQHFQIISIEEHLPSMNEIFLLKVKNDNSNIHE